MPITPTIVNLNATITQAPAASTLQQSGALVSVGGSTTTVGTATFCANLAAVTAILSGAGNHTELANMAGTFFAQSSAAGGPVGVWVLELGTSGAVVTTQITSLGTWISANPLVFYAFLTPASWDTANSANVQTMGSAFASATGRTYFFQQTTSGNLASYTSKCFFCLVPSPTAAGTEFQTAMPFYQWLANNPSVAFPATPMGLRFASGVTPWAFISSAGVNNLATITTILTAFGNVIITASEGGLTNAMLTKGTTMDGNQAMFWYAVDWILTNEKLYLANAIINASNSGAPIVYNQGGINSLLGVANAVCSAAVTFLLALSAVTTAVPFTTYTKANPSAYAAGTYNGFACSLTPQLGFESITFNLVATNFAS